MGLMDVHTLANSTRIKRLLYTTRNRFELALLYYISKSLDLHSIDIYYLIVSIILSHMAHWSQRNETVLPIAHNRLDTVTLLIASTTTAHPET